MDKSSPPNGDSIDKHPGATPLMKAAKAGDAARVQALLLSGADANATASGGETALHFAAGYGTPECVSLLLAASDPLAASHCGWTALLVACAHKKWGNAELLASSSDWMASVEDGCESMRADALLHCAKSDEGSEFIMGRLHLCDPKLRGNSGFTALMHAAMRGDLPLARALAPLSDLDAKDCGGDAALALAHTPEMASLLLEAGASPNTFNALGWSPLSRAAARTNIGLARALLAGGADPKIRPPKSSGQEGDIDRRDAAMLCAHNPELVALLAPLCDRKARCSIGGNALQYAAYIGSAKSAKILMSLGWSPAWIDRNGNDALMHAAGGGSKECVELLLPLSRRERANRQGASAADLADANGHPEIASFIRAFGLAFSEMSEISSAAARPGRAASKSRARI